MSHQPIDMDKRAGQYVALRDKIKDIEAKHKLELAPFKDAKEKLEAVFLQHLISINAESVRTSSGTVSRTVKHSASLADPEAFMRFVIGGEYWDMLDRKANVTAVSDFIEENGAPPPGVNYSSTTTVGIRRA